MLEKMETFYPSNGAQNDTGRRVHIHGVKIEQLPPRCNSDAGRWNHIFSSAEEMESWARELLRARDSGTQMNCAALSHGTRPDKSWSWCWTISEMMALLQTGWKEVTESVSPLSLVVSNTIMAEVQEVAMQSDHAGAEVDIDAFIQGLPGDMLDFRTIKIQGNQVTLIVDAHLGGHQNGQAYFKRGMIVAAAILALTAQGIAVSVLMKYEAPIETTRSKRRDGALDPGLNADESARLSRYATMGCWLFKPGDTLDISTLIIRLAHPGWVRCVFYSAMGLLVGMSNGSTGIKGELEVGSVPIPAAGDSLFNNEATARDFITQLLQAAV